MLACASYHHVLRPPHQGHVGQRVGVRVTGPNGACPTVTSCARPFLRATRCYSNLSIIRVLCVVPRLRPIDIKFMKELHQLVNIIPVIAKADTLTPKEIKALKQKVCELCCASVDCGMGCMEVGGVYTDCMTVVMSVECRIGLLGKQGETGSCDCHVTYILSQVFQEIQENGIQIFVPELFEDDDTSNAAIREIRNTIPFAVVGSNTLLEVNGKKIRGRVYPWGVVEGVSTCSVGGGGGVTT